MWESKGEQCSEWFFVFFYLLCSFGLANDSLVTFSGSLVSLYVPVQGSFLGSLGVFSAIL